MSKRKYMICYDITDDRDRNKVVKELLKIGIRTQYSVFETEISAKKLKVVLNKLKVIINPKTDSIIVYPLSEKTYKKVIRVGNNVSYLPSDDIFV